MKVFSKEAFNEYLRIWEPSQFGSQFAEEFGSKNDGKEVKEYIGALGFVQFQYVDDGKGGKDIVTDKWTKEV